MDAAIYAELERMIVEICGVPDYAKRFFDVMDDKIKALAPAEQERMRRKPFAMEYTEDMFFDDDKDITVCIDNRLPRKTVSPVVSKQNKPCHWHSFFELAYVFSGHFYTIIDGTEYDLPVGSIWMFNTKASHFLGARSEGGKLVNILVRKSTFSDFMLHMIQKNDLFFSFFLHSLYDVDSKPVSLQFFAEDGSPIEEYIYRIVREFYQDYAYSQAMMGYLFCCLITELSRQRQQEVSQKFIGGEKEDLEIAQVISFISSHINTVTLAQLADYFHYSTPYISRFIRHSLGKTFSELLADFKMNKAAHYLQHSDFPIDKVSSLVGYSERSTFDKAFKKRFGMTPAQYRNAGIIF